MIRALLITALLLSMSVMCSAQEQSVYRRSSLCTILMDESNMPKRAEILSAFISTPIPDKYNDHNIEVRIFDPNIVGMSEQARQRYLENQKASGESAKELLARAQAEREKRETQAQPKSEERVQEIVPKKKKSGGGGFGRFLKGVVQVTSAATTPPAQTESSNFGASIDQSDKDYADITAQYVVQQMVSKQLFDRWFLDCNGEFSMELIKERGKYDASAIDVLTAKSSVRGMGLLEDAGEELIHNTFVVVSRYRYVSKDDLVNDVCQVTDLAAQVSGNRYMAMGAAATRAALSASLGAGYYVYITSFLYQLEWSDEIASTLYNTLWADHKSYESSDIFSLKYIGTERAFANVKASVFTEMDEEELVRIATVNATDAVLAKLEKAYDVFRTKTPLYSTEPVTAQIGMKEGLEEGDKYEVLEQVVDQGTNRTKYVRKGVVKVTKNIWDNRYMADEEGRLKGKEQQITVTEFEGGSKGLYPGMMLRQMAK